MEITDPRDVSNKLTICEISDGPNGIGNCELHSRCNHVKIAKLINYFAAHICSQKRSRF